MIAERAEVADPPLKKGEQEPSSTRLWMFGVSAASLRESPPEGELAMMVLARYSKAPYIC